MKRLKKQMETIYWSPVLKVGIDKGKKSVIVEIAEPSSAEDLISSMEERPESFRTTVDLPDVVVRIPGITGEEEWFDRFLRFFKNYIEIWISEVPGLENPKVSVYKEPGVFGDTVSLDVRASGTLSWVGGEVFLRALKRVKEAIDRKIYLNYVKNAVGMTLEDLGLSDKVDLSKVEVVPRVETEGKPFGWEPPYETVLTDVSPKARHYYKTELVRISYVLDFAHVSDEEFEEIERTLRAKYRLDDVVSTLVSLVEKYDPEIDFWMTEEEIEEFEGETGESIEGFSDFVGVLNELKEKFGGRMLRKQDDPRSRLENLREMVQNSLESKDIDDEMRRRLEDLSEEIDGLSTQGEITDEQVSELEEEYKEIVGEGTVIRPVRPVVREMMGGNLGGLGVPSSGPLPEHLGTVGTGPNVIFVKRLRKKLIKTLRDIVRRKLR